MSSNQESPAKCSTLCTIIISKKSLPSLQLIWSPSQHTHKKLYCTVKKKTSEFLPFKMLKYSKTSSKLDKRFLITISSSLFSSKKRKTLGSIQDKNRKNVAFSQICLEGKAMKRIEVALPVQVETVSASCWFQIRLFCFRQARTSTIFVARTMNYCTSVEAVVFSSKNNST